MATQVQAQKNHHLVGDQMTIQVQIQIVHHLVGIQIATRVQVQMTHHLAQILDLVIGKIRWTKPIYLKL